MDVLRGCLNYPTGGYFFSRFKKRMLKYQTMNEYKNFLFSCTEDNSVPLKQVSTVFSTFQNTFFNKVAIDSETAT